MVSRNVTNLYRTDATREWPVLTVYITFLKSQTTLLYLNKRSTKRPNRYNTIYNKLLPKCSETCCNNADRLIHNDRIFNRKIICEDHFTEQYFKKDVERAWLGNSCTDIKPRTRSRSRRLRKVSQSNVLNYCLRRFCFAILFD